MVYEHDVPTIVMLTNLVEKMKAKCSQYWPMCDSETYSNMEVTVVNTTTLADFVIRDIKIKNVSKLMNIKSLVDRHIVILNLWSIVSIYYYIGNFTLIGPCERKYTCNSDYRGENNFLFLPHFNIIHNIIALINIIYFIINFVRHLL